MLPGGHQDVRCASRIDSSAAFAPPRQPIVVDGQADVGRPLFALIRALCDNPPACFGLTLVLENAERLPGHATLPLMTVGNRPSLKLRVEQVPASGVCSAIRRGEVSRQHSTPARAGPPALS